MFNNKDFYPTHIELAMEMIQLAFDKLYKGSLRILDPSAGKGDLIDTIEKYISKKYRGTNYKVDCIENDEVLRDILFNKNYNLIARDFLSFFPSKKYDVIIMNPPFSQGSKHILKAISILEEQGGGRLVSLINAESLDNMFSNDRKILFDKLHQYNAQLIRKEKSFSKAERPTNVSIYLISCDVHVHFNETELFQNIQFKVKQEKKRHSQNTTQGLIPENEFLERLVEEYQVSIQLLKTIDSGIDTLNSLVKHEKTSKNNYFGLKNFDFEKSAHEISKVYWYEVLALPQFTKYLIDKARAEFYDILDRQSEIEFCLENIYEVQQALIQNYRNNIVNAALMVFEDLTKYYMHSYSNNIHYFNGWKTNKAYKVNKKVIIPCENWREYDEIFYLNYNKTGLFNDICIVLSYFDGFKSFTPFSTSQKSEDGVYENELLKLVSYKKGTVHIYFKRLDLLEKFNYFVAKEKNWLPSDEDLGKSQEAKQVVRDIQKIIFTESPAPMESVELIKMPMLGY